MNAKPSIQDEIESVLKSFMSKVRSVGTEQVPLSEACGRILASPLYSFRPSPSIDVSAMDGYAVRISDLDAGEIPVASTLAAGMPPTTLPSGFAVKIFTGAAVPEDADIVIRREDCQELPNPRVTTSIRVKIAPSDCQRGQNIRRRGENAPLGAEILSAGCCLGPNAMAGVATFQEGAQLSVFRRLRVGVINTGDELLPPGVPIEPWQIRDSNGPFLTSALLKTGWAEPVVERVQDSLEQIRLALSEKIESCDAILLTGGVSMGDSDHVPEAIRQAGAEILFHKLPIRPGKPILGAITEDGKPILGLPGNPVSVAVTFRRFAYSILQQAGGGRPSLGAMSVSVQADDDKTLPLVWFRLVSQNDRGAFVVEPSKGSGDIASLATSIGFVEIPPGEPTTGTRLFYPWN
ncbi:Molybdopterin molybdenumtransferase [Pirellula sp. SH-Sr6A]|uniref:molybdopterin molybdotransferase MoeA n=1 Tax=Pirellula sp. SH-Sr6A TaxID=1632865 RepID=UPI00078E9565|nr:molybdopterin molybdotransferase MoeA [Pirellula sp. SH-Sr6A]AMV30668.1 Molybdopterin molybdenumtransferase [Pirellula sp. SH-Sr6A]